MISNHLQKLLKVTSEKNLQMSTEEDRLSNNIVEMVKQRISDTLLDLEHKEKEASQNSFQEINRYMDLALKTFQNMSEPLFEMEQQAQFFMVLSETYKTLGNYDAAEKNFIKARKLAVTEKNMALEGQICYKLAGLYSEMGKWQKADSLLKKSIKILTSIDDSKGIANAKLELAKRAYRKGEYGLSKEHFEAAAKNVDHAYDINQMATINNYLGLIGRIEGDYHRALEFFQKALLDYQGVQNQRGTAEAFNNLGVLYFKKGEMPEAINYFDKALQICQNHGYSPTMAFVYLNKAEFYIKVGDFPMAVNNCGHALEILVHLKSPVGIAKSSNLLARVFWDIGEEKKADYFFRESISLYREFDIPLGYINCSLEYAQFLSEIDKMVAANKILEKINKAVFPHSSGSKKSVNKQKYSYNIEMTPFINQTYNRRQLLEAVHDENILGDRFE
jgi:tetratricopeptide (TPR) repeat protein